jgi:hypothetical protein
MAYDIGLFHNLSVDIVQIPSRLERCIPETAEGFVRVCVATLFDIPPRRLWAKVDTREERDRRNEGRAQLKAPSDIPRIINYKIGGEAEEYTKCS